MSGGVSDYQNNYDLAELSMQSWLDSNDPADLMLAQVRATLALAEAVIETGVVILRASREKT